MRPKIRVKPKQATVECLLCNKDIYVGNNPILGKFITCKSCESVFEIINIDPVMIDWPYYEDDEGFYDDIDDSDNFYSDWS